MLDDVKRYIARERLLHDAEPLWVAVSGGVDSMVLLHVLQALGHPVSVAHVDHGLRGTESIADRAFVEEHCRRAGIPCRSMLADPDAITSAEGVSTQMAARRVRYDRFSELIAAGPPKMALGHHRDDAIESLFIHLLRGPGLYGWSAIPPVSGPFVRPMLCVGRDEVMAYAREHSLPFREDASNADPKYLRNRIRHQLLPLLDQWQPGSRKVLARGIELHHEMDRVVQRAATAALAEARTDATGNARVPFTSILGDGVPRLVLHHLLRPHGFHPDRIEQILRSVLNERTGAVFTAGPIQVVIDRDALLLGPAAPPQREWTIAPDLGLAQEAPFTVKDRGAGSIDLSEGPLVAWLDREKLDFPLLVRPWRQGDRMRPIGLGGTKLVSDILIDAKVPRPVKERTHVLVSGDEVIWLVGHRFAEDHVATPTTGKVLRMEWIG